MQVVHVLRNHRYVILLFERRHEPVPLVWPGSLQLLAQHVVEVIYIHGVGLPRLMCGHARHGIVLPQSVGVPERAQPALNRHSGTSKNNNFLHHFSIVKRLSGSPFPGQSAAVLGAA